MEYGTFVGLTWGGLFFSYVEGIAGNNGMLMMLCFMLCIFKDWSSPSPCSCMPV